MEECKFTIDRVQVYGRGHDGNEVLQSTNYYKRFQRARDGLVESFNAQNGFWWSDGGERIDEAQIPDWVWSEVRSMKREHRHIYRIALPEERNAGTAPPSVKEAEEYPSRTQIMEGLLKLDPNDNSHWTRDGKPSLEALMRFVGVYVSREKVTTTAPQFVRPGRTNAKSEAED
jgi:hypothetical protein